MPGVEDESRVLIHSSFGTGRDSLGHKRPPFHGHHGVPDEMRHHVSVSRQPVECSRNGSSSLGTDFVAS